MAVLIVAVGAIVTSRLQRIKHLTPYAHLTPHTSLRTGFCVDGLEKEAFWQSAVYGWSRSNCDYAYPAVLGE